MRVSNTRGSHFLALYSDFTIFIHVEFSSGKLVEIVSTGSCGFALLQDPAFLYFTFISRV